MTKDIHVAIVFGSFQAGGAEKVMINLVNGFVKNNMKCSIVVLNDEGPLFEEIHPEVTIVNLNCSRARRGSKKFKMFLEGNNPDAIIVSQAHIQLMAMLAVKFSRW